MDAKRFHKDLLTSDDFAYYSLRATFFVRELRALRLLEMIQQVGKLARVSESFDWSDLPQLGIEREAWDRVRSSGIEPALLFCHPRVISEQPRLLLYYRTVALISRKGLKALVGGNIEAVEAGQCDSLPWDWVQKVCVAINAVLCAIVRTAADIGAEHLPVMRIVRTAASPSDPTWLFQDPWIVAPAVAN